MTVKEMGSDSNYSSMELIAVETVNLHWVVPAMPATVVGSCVLGSWRSVASFSVISGMAAPPSSKALA